jgi:HD-like signal output (HDOD) protein
MSPAIATRTPPAATPIQHQLSRTETGKLLGNIQIPPQPEIVRALLDERASDDPDLARITRLISNDVGLSAAVLKAINSPYYGLRGKITTIQHSVELLGMKNIGSLVMGLALKASVKVVGIERYWESASRSAQVAGMLARKRGLNVESAHLYTLFHDSAMPVLIQHIAGYQDTLKHLMGADWENFTTLEDQRHNTNHAVVGGMLAKNWGLPEHICVAIGLHHDITIFSSDSVASEVVTLIAIGHLAEGIESALSRQESDCQCGVFGAASTAHLMLVEGEMRELTDSAMDLLGVGEY